MFANALRTQARLALVGSRAAVLPYASSFALVSRRSIPSFAARSLSTSQVIRADSDYGEVDRSRTEPNATMYLGNLPFSIGEHELRELLSDFGEVKAIRMGIRPDGVSKGYAHIEFADLSSAIKMFEAHIDEPLYVVGRAIKLDYAPARSNRGDPAPYHRLYISDFNKDEQTLREAFASYGDKLVDVHLLTNRMTGDVLNSGFVEFDSIETATEALNEFNGRELEYGLKFNLTYAHPKREAGLRSHGGDWGGGQSNNYGASRGGGYQRGGAGGGGGWQGGQSNGYGAGGGGGYQRGGGGGGRGGYRGGRGGGGSYGGGRGGDDGGGGYRGRSGY